MTDNNNLSKEELNALLGGEANPGVRYREDEEEAAAGKDALASEAAGVTAEMQERDDVGDAITVKRLLHAVQALHARVEMLEDQVRELRLQAISQQIQPPDKRPAPQSKPAPKPPAPAPRTEPQLSRLERYGRGRA